MVTERLPFPDVNTGLLGVWGPQVQTKELIRAQYHRVGCYYWKTTQKDVRDEAKRTNDREPRAQARDPQRSMEKRSCLTCPHQFCSRRQRLTEQVNTALRPWTMLHMTHTSEAVKSPAWPCPPRLPILSVEILKPAALVSSAHPHFGHIPWVIKSQRKPVVFPV